MNVKGPERTEGMFETIARVPTVNGSRYLQQLCKHWSHNLKVEFTPETGTVIFPKNARGADWPGDATLTLTLTVEPSRPVCVSGGAAEIRLARRLARDLDHERRIEVRIQMRRIVAPRIADHAGRSDEIARR
jgi:hypothetical protein